MDQFLARQVEIEVVLVLDQHGLLSARPAIGQECTSLRFGQLPHKFHLNFCMREDFSLQTLSPFSKRGDGEMDISTALIKDFDQPLSNACWLPS